MAGATSSTAPRAKVMQLSGRRPRPASPNQLRREVNNNETRAAPSDKSLRVVHLAPPSARRRMAPTHQSGPPSTSNPSTLQPHTRRTATLITSVHHDVDSPLRPPSSSHRLGAKRASPDRHRPATCGNPAHNPGAKAAGPGKNAPDKTHPPPSEGKTEAPGPPCCSTALLGALEAVFHNTRGHFTALRGDILSGSTGEGTRRAAPPRRPPP